MNNLARFIENQEIMTHLYIQESEFTDAATAELFKALSKAQCINTLERVDFDYSANFNSDDPCQQLALFLSTAMKLRNCYIGSQKGERKVKAEINYAQEDTKGTIKVLNKADNAEITTKETDRTNDPSLSISC